MNKFSDIINPYNGTQTSIFSSSGKKILKNYIRIYKMGGEPLQPMPLS